VRKRRQDRDADIAAQRPTGDAGRAAAQYQRRCHQDRAERPRAGPSERLTVTQAIRAQTIDAAWQLFADDVVGSLEVGKYADMVVLSTHPRTVPPEEITDLEVQRTFLAGQQVYPK
jgi:predicted amidohydrolase YtcJ